MTVDLMDIYTYIFDYGSGGTNQSFGCGKASGKGYQNEKMLKKGHVSLGIADGKYENEQNEEDMLIINELY